MHRPSRSPRLLSMAAFAALVALVATGCAGASKGPKQDIVWPLPPDPPRIKYVRSFGRPDHLKPSFLSTLGSLFVPRDPRAHVGQPTGMAFSSDEKRLYVASAARGGVVRIDLEKESMKRVASDGGNGPGAPFGVALDGDENLYVSDKSGGEIWVFSRGGDLLRKFGKGKLDNPMSLAIDRRRQVLYVVNGAHSVKTDHRVELFSLKGDHVRTLGKRGHEAGQFNFPTHLTVAADGSLFVSDMLNFRVQIFGPGGDLQGTFGQLGDGQPGTFDKSKGIAFDTFKNIYVVDSQHGVQIFNAQFRPLMSFGEGFMGTPAPIAIDSRNRIFVGDFAMGTIHQFQLVNTTAKDSVDPAPSPAPAKAAPRATPAAASAR